MDKKDFVLRLEKALKKLQKTERDKYISYYDELISDMMENGMPETEAVRKQGTVEGIAAEIMKNVDADKVIRADIAGILLAVFSIVLVGVSAFAWFVISGISISPFGQTGVAISMIGGADGPTSVFLAGRISHPVWLYLITAGVVLVSIFYCVRKFRNKRK